MIDLLVLIPLIAGLVSITLFHEKRAYCLTLASTVASLVLSIMITDLNVLKNYTFGNWTKDIGIEYKIDLLSHRIILYANALLLIVLIGCRKLLSKEIQLVLPLKYSHLFYSILLFAHAGFIGILATNDLFNLYVFIEIASLASYILISLSKDKRALIAAIDYLVTGSMGAAFILIAIGMILAITGTLNLDQIKISLTNNQQSLQLASFFFLTGSILKIAAFPVSSWLTKTYNFSSSSLIVYFAGISGIVNFYLLLQGIQLIFINQNLYLTLLLIANCSIFAGALSALSSKTFREFITYSTISHIGYTILLISLVNDQRIIYWYLITDSLVKVGLFFINAQLENWFSRPVMIQDLAILKHNNPWISYTLLVLVFSNLGLPITVGFINKIYLLNALIDQHSYQLIAVLFASVLAFYYNYRIVQNVYFNNASSEHSTHIPLTIEVRIVLLLLVSLVILLSLLMQ